MFFGKKELEVSNMLNEFFSKLREIVVEFQKMVFDYLANDKQFKDESYKVHCLEQEIDAIRRKIELKFYEGAFLPVYREDYYVLLEESDKIANKCESVSDLIVLTRPDVPEFLDEEINELLKKTVECYELFYETGKAFQEDFSKVKGKSKLVGAKETEIDKIEWDLIKKLFKSDLDLAHKLHLREFIISLTSISDRIEDASDWFNIMIVKRRM